MARVKQAQMVTAPEQESFEAKLARIQNEPLKAHRIKPKSKLLVKLQEYLPLVAALSRDTSASSSSFADLAGSLGHVAEPVLKNLKGAKLLTLVFDFLRYPLFALSTWLMGEKQAFKLNDFAEWVYSAAGITLGALIIALPAAAFGILVAASVAGVLVATKDLFQLYRNRKTLPEELKQLEQQEPELREALVAKLASLNGFKRRYATAATPEAKAAVEQEFKASALETEIAEARTKIRAVKDRKIEINILLEKDGRWELMKRNLTLLSASLVLAGTVLTAMMPVVGFALLGTAAVMGVVTAIGDLVKFFTRKKDLKADVEAREYKDSPDNGLDADVDPELAEALKQGAGYNILSGLGGPVAEEAIGTPVPNREVPETPNAQVKSEIKNRFQVIKADEQEPAPTAKI